MTSRPRSLATAQIEPVRGDIEVNLERHLACIEVAADEGAEVCVFPELSLTGYELELARELALAPDDARLEPLARFARERSIHVVAGGPLEIGSRLHLALFAFDPAGKIRHYTKQRLGAFPPHVSPTGSVPPPEGTVFVPGDLDPLLPLPSHTAALAICADTGDPRHPERAAGRGATSYLASMFFTPSERTDEERKLAGHAREHVMAVALANFGGPTGGLDAAGASAIWSPTGELLVQLAATGTAVAVAREVGPRWRTAACKLAAT